MRDELKLRPIEETCLKQKREIAMKIQLLVNGGKILVQNLQLRKPGKRMTSTPSKSMHILNFDVNVIGGPFPCGHCGHIFRAFNRKCRAGDLTSDTLKINFSEPKFEI